MATTIPRRPMETNIQRQPKEIISTVSSGGAIVGPSEEAQFQIPVGNPRSRTFHQSRTIRAGKHRRFSSTKEDAGDDELPEAPDQTSPRLGKRPDQQAEAQQAARTNAVGQRPARKLAESISPEKCGKQKPHVGDRHAEFFTDQRIGDGERCTVDIVARSRDHKKYKGRSLHPPDAGWNWGVGHDRTSSKALTSPPTAACGSTASGALPGHPEMGGQAIRGLMRSGSNK